MKPLNFGIHGEYPCSNCPDRKVGCHSVCDKYKTACEKKREIREKVIKRRDTDEYFVERKCKR